MIAQFGQISAGQGGAGQAVQAVTLTGGGLCATILTLGSVLQDLRLAGAARGLCLGFDSVAGYEAARGYHGALVGPLANRLTGAQAVIAGRLWQLPGNEPSGALLHSGPGGVQGRVWQIDSLASDSLRLVLSLAHGEDGLPGNRRISADWQLRPDRVLALTLRAQSDAPTLMNLANHSYWNLDGAPSSAGHRLRIAADAVCEVDAALLPTGRLLPVAGGPLDFRTARALHPGAPALDTNFCLTGPAGTLREVAWLQGAAGLTMALATDAPGLQVYDHRHPEPGGPGPYAGIALEPQSWPDAPHHAHFPPVTLDPGQTWLRRVEWRFGAA